MATVFVINEPKYQLDFSAAESFGEIVFVFPLWYKSTSRMASQAVSQAENVLKDFTSDDFLLFCGGDPTSFGIAMTVAAINTITPVKTLVWERPIDGKRGFYTVASFPFKQ